MRGSHHFHPPIGTQPNHILSTPRDELRLKMDFPDAWEFLPSAWVCAQVLTGSGQMATEEVRAAVAALCGRPDIVTRRRRERMIFKALLSRKFSAASGLSSLVLSRLQNLPEPGRSALLLLHLTGWDVAAIADFLEVPRSRLPRLLFEARRFLDSLESVHPSKEVLALAAERHFEKAAANGSCDNPARPMDVAVDQRSFLSHQIEVDWQIHQALETCIPAEAVVDELKASIGSSRRVFPGLRDPAFWAVAIGIVLLAGVLVWNAVGSPPELPTAFSEVIEKVEAGDSPGPMAIPSAEWDDWLLLGDLEGFSLPPGFPAGRVRAAGIVEFGGGKAAVLDLPDIPARVVALRSSRQADRLSKNAWQPALRDSGEQVVARRHDEWVFVAWAPVPVPQLAKELDLP